MIIQHNISAMNGARNNKINQVSLSGSQAKLSSGYRINKAGDDASGLAVSEKMRAQIRGQQQASRNASDGINFIQTAEGFLQEMQDVLHRIRELAVQASNGIYTAEDRSYIQFEIAQLVDEVDRVASQAQFNGQTTLTGRFAQENGMNTVADSMWFHIGANMDQRMRVYIGTMTATALGLRQEGTGEIVSLSTAESANQAIGLVDNSMRIVNEQRASLGAYQNRLEHAVRGLDVGVENMQASESQIRDADMAAESVRLSTFRILAQSSIAMLAQANATSQNVLQLLQ